MAIEPFDEKKLGRGFAKAQWPLLPALCTLLLVTGTALMRPHANVAEPPVLHQFWLGAAVMGAGFALSWRLKSLSRPWFWGVALATRLLLLPMAPGDDMWRYLWEGHIQILGFSPYHLAPNAPELEPYRTAWWGAINHSDVSAIYPPITQLGFGGWHWSHLARCCLSWPL